ncbi:MAG: transcriptional regulator [Syntrophobacteria bacterium]
MIRLLVFIFLGFILYKLLRPLIRSLAGPDRSREAPGTAELVQDPQCGAYLLPSQGVSARLGGKTYYFCSERCRDRYLLEHSERKGEKDR